MGQPRKLDPGHHVVAAKAGTAEETKQEVDLASTSPEEHRAPSSRSRAWGHDERACRERRHRPGAQQARARLDGIQSAPHRQLRGSRGSESSSGSITGCAFALGQRRSASSHSPACEGNVCNPSEDGDLSSARTTATVSTVSFVAAGVGWRGGGGHRRATDQELSAAGDGEQPRQASTSSRCSSSEDRSGCGDGSSQTHPPQRSHRCRRSSCAARSHPAPARRRARVSRDARRASRRSPHLPGRTDWDGIGFVESVLRISTSITSSPPPRLSRLRRAPAGRLATSTRPHALAAKSVAVPTGVAAVIFLSCGDGAGSSAPRAAALDRHLRGGLSARLARVYRRWKRGAGPRIRLRGRVRSDAVTAGRSVSGSASPSDSALGVRLSPMGAALSLSLLVLAPLADVASPARSIRRGSASPGACFVAIVGPKHLLALARTHATGHFEVWGGSAISEPGAMRGVWLARDLFVDGIGVDRDALGVAIALFGLALVVGLGLTGVARERIRARAPIVLVLAPYLAWIALRAEPPPAAAPRALPIVVALACGLALARHHVLPARSLPRRGFLPGSLAIRTGHRRVRAALDPSAGRAARRSRAHAPRRSSPSIGGPSARFFELEPSGAAIHGGDARRRAAGAQSHSRPLPTRVLVTERGGRTPRRPRTRSSTSPRFCHLRHRMERRRAPASRSSIGRRPFL